MRPGLEWRLFLHRVKTSSHEDVEGFSADWLRLRHYESYDGEEFVRKWLAHVGAGPMRLRPERDRLRIALEQLVDCDLPVEVRATYFRRLYARWIEDDAETLTDLGLLVGPRAGTHQPERLAEEDRADLERLLELLAGEDKRHAHPKWPEMTLLRAFGKLLPGLDGTLADAVAAEVDRLGAEMDRAAAAGDGAPEKAG